MFRGHQRNVSLGTGRGRKERGEEKEGRQRRKKESEEREGGRDREKKGGKEEKKERKIRSDRVSRERRLGGLASRQRGAQLTVWGGRQRLLPLSRSREH